MVLVKRHANAYAEATLCPVGVRGYYVQLTDRVTGRSRPYYEGHSVRLAWRAYRRACRRVDAMDLDA
jgi:hypothetical protein